MLPGASLDESFTEDDDDDWLRSLEGPPSPCDVTFINDNILIDGRSSMTQKSRLRQKVSIKNLTCFLFENLVRNYLINSGKIY